MRTRIEEQKVVPRFRSRAHALWWLSRWYYPSDHWRKTSRQHRRKYPFCQRCRWRKSVQTHHLRYDCLWEEPPSALMAVCLPCHAALEREKALRRRR